MWLHTQHSAHRSLSQWRVRVARLSQQGQSHCCGDERTSPIVIWWHLMVGSCWLSRDVQVEMAWMVVCPQWTETPTECRMSIGRLDLISVSLHLLCWAPCNKICCNISKRATGQLCVVPQLRLHSYKCCIFDEKMTKEKFLFSVTSDLSADMSRI